MIHQTTPPEHVQPPAEEGLGEEHAVNPEQHFELKVEIPESFNADEQLPPAEELPPQATQDHGQGEYVENPYQADVAVSTEYVVDPSSGLVLNAAAPTPAHMTALLSAAPEVTAPPPEAHHHPEPPTSPSLSQPQPLHEEAPESPVSHAPPLPQPSHHPPPSLAPNLSAADVKSQPRHGTDGAILVTDHDVLSGRGASINQHRGNQHFRALCFHRKAEFDVGNHTNKRRIATEVVQMVRSLDPSGRFLKRQWEGPSKRAADDADRPSKGPWLELSGEKAVLKACQVMRDFRRPDRLVMKEVAAAERAAGGGSRKRRKTLDGAEEVRDFRAVWEDCDSSFALDLLESTNWGRR